MRLGVVLSQDFWPISRPESWVTDYCAKHPEVRVLLLVTTNYAGHYLEDVGARLGLKLVSFRICRSKGWYSLQRNEFGPWNMYHRVHAVAGVFLEQEAARSYANSLVVDEADVVMAFWDGNPEDVTCEAIDRGLMRKNLFCVVRGD